ncbi:MULTISPECIES: hypothetical protein [Methylobacterium]|uniref:hypothetical protein n=1 Tax=Methylobacterium TaxID=407 RepID=UPI0010464B7A|nr:MULTISPECIES: hypothetical protein [Methylobacterium]MDR7037658.1 hypothetical protein [Methylobacterium sp. BE186]
MPHSSIRPLAALSVLAPLAAAAAAVTTLRQDLSWYTGLALFYGSLAAAQLGYLAVCVLRGSGSCPTRLSPPSAGKNPA